MIDIISDQTGQFLHALINAADETVMGMERYGEGHGPTTIGHKVSQLFCVLTKLAGTEQVFKLG